MQPQNFPREPIDVVYTWVDDQQPGYLELLSKYATHKRDSDPARTRDNLDLLRFSFRSLERYMPWINRVYLLTCRPQVPKWLDTSHPRVSVIHHDQIMPAEILPTFNSLAITSFLHCIPGLSRWFIYFEDDMLLLSPVTLAHFFNGPRRKIFAERNLSPSEKDLGDPETAGGWNLALAHSNALLDKRYGKAQRNQVNHSPLLVEALRWKEVMDMFPESLTATRQSRFRAVGNFAPDYLYQQLDLAEGSAELEPHSKARYTAGYVPLEDFWPVTAWELWRLHRRKPKWVTLNDNFGRHPSRVTVAMIRRQLQAWFPERSSFERDA